MGIQDRQVEAAFNPHTLVVDKNLSIVNCSKIMKDMCVGLLVIAEDDRPVGVISERDIVYKLVAENKNLEDYKVEDLMSHAVVTIRENKTLLEAWEIMNIHKIRHLVVINDEEKLEGVLSVRDIVNRVALEQEVTGLLDTLNIEIDDLPID